VRVDLLKNAFPLKIPLPYPPCQIIDLAGNPGTPSLQGREKKEGKLPQEVGEGNKGRPPSVKAFRFPTTDLGDDWGEMNCHRQ